MQTSSFAKSRSKSRQLIYPSHKNLPEHGQILRGGIGGNREGFAFAPKSRQYKTKNPLT
jgi:hypothetical protein